jgi:predicted GTPase
MHKASIVQAAGANFCLLGPRHTQIPCDKPVVAVTAVRTGAGKSPIAQKLAWKLSQDGIRVAILRHPMPYGDLTRQAVERFSCIEDLDRFSCTIEEREEYEPYLELGLAIYAGVDYQAIVNKASSEADALLWDGGNNDSPFIAPGLLLVVVDALRPGHETSYYRGETNLRAADILIVNKVGSASNDTLARLRSSLQEYNPRAVVVEGDLKISVSDASQIQGRRVLVVEDGPTLTHGGMTFGAGTLAARECQASELIEPRDSAVGSIAQTLREYPQLKEVLPALGYSEQQCRELTETIESSKADVVVDASPARLDRFLNLSIPVVRVRYQFQQTRGPLLEDLVTEFLQPM